MIYSDLIKASKDIVSRYGWELKSSYTNKDGREMHFYAYDKGVMVVVVEEFILPITKKPIITSKIIEFSNKNDANNWFKEVQRLSDWKKIIVEENAMEEMIC